MKRFKGKELASFIVCVVFSVLSAVSFILMQIGLHKRFSFFTIVSGWRMIFYSLMVLLPVIVCTAIILLYRKIGKKTKAALYALLATSVVFSLVFTVAFSIMPPYASITNDPNNYMKFDESCPAFYYSYNDVFPAKIPQNAEKVKYVYRYSTYPDLSYDVFAQWTLTRSEYEAERKRLVDMFPDAEVEMVGEYCVVYLSDEKKSTLDHFAFAFNDNTFTLRYMVSYIENVDINDLSPYYEEVAW